MLNVTILKEIPDFIVAVVRVHFNGTAMRKFSLITLSNLFNSIIVSFIQVIRTLYLCHLTH